jgi:hypothetical protein
VSASFSTRETCTGTVTDGSTTTLTGESGHGFPIIRADDGTIDGGNLYAQTRNRGGLALFVWQHSGGGSGPQGTASNTTVLRGKFLNRRKATGILSWEKEEQSSFGDQFACNSGNVRWTARR